MTQLWPDGQPILVELDEHSRPVSFRWLGRTYRLGQLIQQRQVDTDWWQPQGRVWRDYYTLITTCGLLCTLVYDHLADAWRLIRLYD
ncbi:MAG TPA: DUF6504 family protein [Caldilineaceae bacterium]|nr:DUF6504 family protein [Caldilineaceae bacterium]